MPKHGGPADAVHERLELAFIAQINSVQRTEKRRIGQYRHTLTLLSQAGRAPSSKRGSAREMSANTTPKQARNLASAWQTTLTQPPPVNEWVVDVAFAEATKENAPQFFVVE